MVTTLLGTGNIPESHPLSLGMGGMHGEAYANRAIQGCDVLIAMGMRFDDRITGRLDSFAKQAKIIHFELDSAEVGKNVVPDLAVIGDLGETLPALLPLIEDRRHQVWIQELKEWKADTAQADILNYEVEDELIPPFVMRQLWHATHNIANGPAIVVTDVGQHQMWECQYYIHDHAGQLLTSGGLGTMGFALPAAIGAQMAFPDRLVWAVVGDGGFQMTLQELAVLKQEHLPVKIAIINNGFLGMVRQWQQLFYEKRYTGTPVVSPDFVKLADAYDIPALSVYAAGPGRGGLRAGHCDAWPVPDRLPRQGRGQRLSDGGAGCGRRPVDPPAQAVGRAGLQRRAAELLIMETTSARKGRIIMTHTLIAWMRDKPGVLNRVAGMLRRRNFNIDSLQVGHSETPGISRMTFVVNGNQHMVDQVIKQLRKIVDVTRVEDITEQPTIARRWRWCAWPPPPRTARRSCSWWISTTARSWTSRLTR